MIGKRRWWVAGLVAVWALVLVVAAVWSAQHDSATVRGQSGLTEGRVTLDRAVETVAEAAGPQVGVDIEPYQLTLDCRLTLARAGTEVDQTMVLTVPEGQEAELLDGLADRLPEQWSARYNPNRNRFFADAGDFVAIRGEVTGPGQIQLTVSTGCRPGDDPEVRG